ncbi:hypothetical protein Rleg9DRAFT_0482 [Rhizobium leguminosarum bv. trifolii WSM597]|uniref:Phage protein n=1 Tax=Rhizobium leguminosarum bv. trifolii WSM597 TaxID=754764 RepID=I9N4X1_RHILT|nr:hypothetical protein [Rhizobium leguminosarum]EJB01742.1 hypothetical protein Rleg9DRAFT_0482 [Rhizobium leguminosarum bv. trifolii WSM597]
MFKITGLNKLKKKIDQLSNFSQAIDGEIANVSFNPTDPASIEAAIQEAHDAIDQKAIAYERNDWITSLVEQLKESVRDQILERAAVARLEGSSE